MKTIRSHFAAINNKLTDSERWFVQRSKNQKQTTRHEVPKKLAGFPMKSPSEEWWAVWRQNIWYGLSGNLTKMVYMKRSKLEEDPMVKNVISALNSYCADVTDELQRIVQQQVWLDHKTLTSTQPVSLVIFESNSGPFLPWRNKC